MKSLEDFLECPEFEQKKFDTFQVDFLEQKLVSESAAASSTIKQLMTQQVDMAETMYQAIEDTLQGDMESLMNMRRILASYLNRCYKAGL